MPRDVQERVLPGPEGERRFLLYTPATLDPDRPAPLVLEFHGSGATPAEQMRYSALHRIADREGFILAAPRAAIPMRMFDSTPEGAAWNVPGVPLILDSGDDTPGPDDVAFVRRVVDAVAAERNVDRRRVYAAGFSGGGRFCSYLAYAAPDLLAAVGTVAGLRLPSALRHVRPAPLIAFHGTADPLNPYWGGAGDRWDLSVPETADLVARTMGAHPTGAPEAVSDAVSRLVYATPGGEVGLVQYTVRGGGHAWPGTPYPIHTAVLGPVTREMDAGALIWEFFTDHRAAG
ncbi:alpha/beta hydrolase family esterase [Wenjunlia tyrosinilytica]|uniref:alpha/beta hydrolase family esterase n=1 Tax=Wenjunlia tyrosinilytica TaxID=1544741 RepID=UPI00166E9FF7|nr:PHB depolymerase family esterase [Wenjunlia tyrosinilytica]